MNLQQLSVLRSPICLGILSLSNIHGFRGFHGLHGLYGCYGVSGFDGVNVFHGLNELYRFSWKPLGVHG